MSKEPSTMKEIKIHQVLRALIKDRNVTTTQVSKATGVPNSTLSTWLLPGAKPRDPRHIAAVAEYFQVSIEYLLFEAIQPPALNVLPMEQILDGYYRLRLERVILPQGSAPAVPKKEKK